MRSRIGLETIDTIALGEEKLAVKRGWLSTLIRQMSINAAETNDYRLPPPIGLRSPEELEKWYASDILPVTYSLGLSWAALRGIAVFSQNQHPDSIHASHNFVAHAYNPADYLNGAMINFVQVAEEDFINTQAGNVESIWTEVHRDDEPMVEFCRELGYRTLAKANGSLTLVKDL